MLQKGLTSYVVGKIIILKISKMQIHQLMSQKLFKILCRKFEKKKKEFGKIFLIKVSFYIAFEKLFMGRKFYIPYLQSFRVKSPTRVHARNVLNK